MDGRLPLILDGGECDWGVESTVVSVVGEKPTLFRPGHITLEDPSVRWARKWKSPRPSSRAAGGRGRPQPRHEV